MTWTYRNEIAEGILQISETIRGTVTRINEEFKELTIAALKLLTLATATAIEIAKSKAKLNKPSPEYFVYFGIKVVSNMETVVYVGITNAPKRREDEHKGRFNYIRTLNLYDPLTKNQARAVEQLLIQRNPKFQNLINSISKLNILYITAIPFAVAYLEINDVYKYYNDLGLVN